VQKPPVLKVLECPETEVFLLVEPISVVAFVADLEVVAAVGAHGCVVTVVVGGSFVAAGTFAAVEGVPVAGTLVVVVVVVVEKLDFYIAVPDCTAVAVVLDIPQ
jgi:hypothetical protein